MKKYLLIFLALICFGINAYADETKTCKVNDTDGSVEVSVYDGNKSEGTASMSFSNDTDIDVNVRYTITFYDNNNGFIGNKSGSKRVPPHSETTLNDISIGKPYSYIKFTSLSGEKCR